MDGDTIKAECDAYKRGVLRESSMQRDVKNRKPAEVEAALRGVGRLRRLSEEPEINTEFSGTGADQPNKNQYVKHFGEIEEIVEPVEGR